MITSENRGSCMGLARLRPPRARNRRSKEVVGFAKPYQRLGFRLDYVDEYGCIRDYYPDFIVKLSDTSVYNVDTNELEDFYTPLKMARSKAWCEDIKKKSKQDKKFDFVYIEQKKNESFLDSYVNGYLKTLTSHSASS